MSTHIDKITASNTTGDVTATGNAKTDTADGYAFDSWKLGNAVIQSVALGENGTVILNNVLFGSKTLDVQPNTTYTYTAYFGVDKIDRRNPDIPGPDNIPDDYQGKVTYKVTGGWWSKVSETDANDGTDKHEVVTYLKDGKLSNASDAATTLTSVPNAGQNPNTTKSYVAGGSWDPAIAESKAVTRGTDAQKDKTFEFKYPLGYTVKYYFETSVGAAYSERPNHQSNTTQPVGTQMTYMADPSQIIADGSLDFTGTYVLDKVEMTPADGKVAETDNGCSVKVYFALDQDTDEPGKGVPDRYQATITYKLDGTTGSWNDTTITDAGKTVTVVLYQKQSNEQTGAVQWVKKTVGESDLHIPTRGAQTAASTPDMYPADNHTTAGSWTATATGDDTVGSTASPESLVKENKQPKEKATYTFTWKFNPEGTYNVTYHLNGGKATAGDQVVTDSVAKTFFNSATPKVVENAPGVTHDAVSDVAVVFVGWTANSSVAGIYEVGSTNLPELVTDTATTSKDGTHNFYAVWSKDENGNGTADIYEAKVTYNVVHGKWDTKTGTEAESYTVWYSNFPVSIDANPAATADSGYDQNSSVWTDNKAPKDTQIEVNKVYEFTLTFNRMAYTINYHFVNKNGTEVTLADGVLDQLVSTYHLPQSNYATLNEVVNLNFAGTLDVKNSADVVTDSYLFDKVDGATKGTNGYTFTVNTTDPSKNVIDVYYDIDNWSKDIDDGNGHDSIPDKYQAKVTYSVATGADTGSVTPATQILTDPAYKENEAFTPNQSWKASLTGKATERTGFAFAYWTNTTNNAGTKTYLADLSQLADADKLTVQGGSEYSYAATFLSDTKGGEPDPETKGDGTPDAWQAFVKFESANPLQGKVEGAPTALYQTFDLSQNSAGLYTGDIIPSLAGITKTGLTDKDGNHYTFDFWACGNAQNVNPTDKRTVYGGDVVVFQANFALDNLKDADKTPEEGDTDSETGGDDIPDKYQVTVKYVSANTAQGEVTGSTTKVFTLVNTDGSYATAGTITPGTEGVVTSGKGNYVFNSWTPNPASELDVTGGNIYTYTASWTYIPPAPNTYGITINVTNGTSNPAGPVSVTAGNSTTISFTANEGYTLDSVTVDGAAAALTNGAYTFSNVNANHTISVVYVAVETPEPPTPTHTVTWVNWDGVQLGQMANVPNGTNTPSSSYTGTTPVRPSDAVYNYTFSGWSAGVVDADGNVTYTAQYTPSLIYYPTPTPMILSI